MIPALPLLAAALTAYGWYLWGGWRHLGRAGSRVVRVRSTGNRFARIGRRMLLLFGGTGLFCLVLLDGVGALLAMPVEFAPAQRLAVRLTGLDASQRWPMMLLVSAMLAGGVLAGLIARIRRRPPMTLGRVEGVTPRSLTDLIPAALLSVIAGLCEELFCRLVLPLLVALVGGGAVLGFGMSAALFGLAHRYQGAVGIAATATVALLLSAAYLLTGQLWVAVVLHTTLDLTGLVVRPVVAGMVRRSETSHRSR